MNLLDEPSCLHPESIVALRKLAQRSWALDCYLAGSAGLASYIGHRSVRDLDFMGFNRLTSPQRRDLLQDLLDMDPSTRVETARDGFLSVRFGEGVGARFFYYPYPLIDPEEELEGMAVASALDLGLMKLGAITSRGSRKDFVDLYLLTRRLPLAQMLERSSDKFGHVLDFPMQCLKGLSDLEGALNDPMPHLERPLEWSEIESWLQGEVRELGRQWIGLETRLHT